MQRLSTHLFAWEEAERHWPSDQAGRVVIQCPYAGGSLHSLSGYRSLLPGYRHLVAHYTWQRSRTDDDPADSIATMAAAVVSEYLALDEGRGGTAGSLIIGHSLGSYVAIESACRLEAAGRPCAGLVLCSSIPPGSEVLDGNPMRILADSAGLEEASDETLARVLVAGGTVPAEIMNDPELLAALLPVIRRECKIGARYTGPQAKISCPVVAMGGLDDAAVPSASLHDWSRFTADDFSVRLWPGGHFWFRKAGAEVGEAIEHAIRSGQPSYSGTVMSPGHGEQR